MIAGCVLVLVHGLRILGAALGTVLAHPRRSHTALSVLNILCDHAHYAQLQADIASFRAAQRERR